MTTERELRERIRALRKALAEIFDNHPYPSHHAGKALERDNVAIVDELVQLVDDEAAPRSVLVLARDTVAKHCEDRIAETLSGPAYLTVDDPAGLAVTKPRPIGPLDQIELELGELRRRVDRLEKRARGPRHHDRGRDL